jgi:SepF-like predicted cell division protein (DUF552 family)
MARNKQKPAIKSVVLIYTTGYVIFRQAEKYNLTIFTMAEEKKEYMVKISEDTESGHFVNAISVHFNGNECVLDMGYTLPNAPKPTIKIVSRLNMTHKTAESFLKVLSNALLDFKNKSNGK